MIRSAIRAIFEVLLEHLHHFTEKGVPMKAHAEPGVEDE